MADEKEEIDYIINEAQKYLPVKKVILFGSRSKKTSLERSDYDFAIDAPEATEIEWLKFSEKIQEQTPTLCQIDLIWLNKPISEKLKNDIRESGIIVYDAKNK